MLMIINQNTDSVQTISSLTALCKTENIGMMFTQKALSRERTKIKLLVYISYSTLYRDTNRVLATFIKSNIPYNIIQNPIPCDNNIEILAVTLTIFNHIIDVYMISTEK